MGSNIHPTDITKAATAISIVNNICSIFKYYVRGKESSQHHPIPSYKKDLQMIITILSEENLLQGEGKKRCHSCFKFTHGILDDFDKDKLKSWLVGCLTYA